MPKLIKQDRGNYTNISNIVVRDSRLSWKARGIFIYLWSQANEWQFYVNEIATHAPDGERSLRTGLKELEKYGYLERTHRHNDEGNFDGMDWILTDTPDQNNHHVQNSNDGKKAENQQKKVQNAFDAKRTQCEMHSMQNAGVRTTNYKNYQNKEITNKRKEKSSAKAEPAISEIIDYLNKKAGTHYSPKTKAYQELINTKLAEGYTINDFKKVINNQAFSWQNTPAWKYMRPSTLFKDKFDEYLHANDLNRYSGKRVEKGTDWSKKEIDTSSGIPTDELKELFRNLNNKEA